MQDKEKRFYSIAGLGLEIVSPPFPETKNLDRFRAEPRHGEEHFFVDFVGDVMEAEGELMCEHPGIRVRIIEGGCSRSFFLQDGKTLLMRCDDIGTEHRAFFSGCHRDKWGGNAVLHIMDLPSLVLKRGGCFLHASFVLHEDRAVLFCGAKQMGKSTQAALWQRHRGAAVVNGDRALIRKLGGKWCACGSPYCGTSKICENRIAPIGAIVILSKSGENVPRAARPREAFAAMLDNCSYDPAEKEQVEAVAAIAAELVEETVFVKFACRPDESAVMALEEFLWQK